MTERAQVLASIVETIKDYHSKPTDAHIDRWVSQFPADVQLPLLREMDHVLKKTYFSLSRVNGFLHGLLENEELAGTDPCAYWKSVGFLQIQQRGNSQREMLAILDVALKHQCGFQLSECGGGATTFIYVDDAIFSGGHVRTDLTQWIQESAPKRAHVHIVAMAFHKYGQWYTDKKISEAAKQSAKVITTQWWRVLEVEDRKSKINQSDVLRPVSLPDSNTVKQYASSLKHAVVFRELGHAGENKFFSGEPGRGLLEQQFLTAGVNIRSMCPHLNTYQRPLGNMVLETLGFGSMFVTFRNCPTTRPLHFGRVTPGIRCSRELRTVRQRSSACSRPDEEATTRESGSDSHIRSRKQRGFPEDQ